jgi:photosystem II stability/assembly factor-like uncharacterized protein
MKKKLLTAIMILTMFTCHAQWLVQNPGFTKDSVGFYEMSLPDKNTVWAVCYDGKQGLLSGNPVLSFTRTVDGGNTWIPGYVGSDKTLRFSNISAIDGQEAWVAMHKMDYSTIPTLGYVGFGKGGGIFHTTDEGVTWEQTAPGELFDSNSTPRFIYFKDKNHGIAVGDPNQEYWEIYLTNNKGKKWKRVTSSNIPAPLAGERGWISGYSTIGDTIWFGTTTGRMYKSMDFGKTWAVHTVTLMPGTEVNEIAFLDDGKTGVAHLRNNAIFRTYVFSTTDGGLTWTNYFQPPNWKNSRVTAVPGTNAFVSTSTHGNPAFTGSSVSYDAGQTWAHIDQTAQKAVCRFYDATTGYAGGFHFSGHPFWGTRGIFKSTIVFQIPPSQVTGVTITEKTAPVEKSSTETLVKVYPVPAKDVVAITLDDVLVNRPIAINIINSNGKVVETRSSFAARTIQLNVTTLAPGFYVVQIKSGTEVINKAITIVR